MWTSRKAEEAEASHQKAYGWAARDASGILSPFSFSRRENGANDITIKILYCGICHSDLHVIRSDFGPSLYPLVPGHEIAGEVTRVGNQVKKFKVGDKAGVGCFIGSCQTCGSCERGLENYCPDLLTTYTIFNNGKPKTYGGFSDFIVVNERFAVQFPDNLPLDSGAPLLCAGITVYSPMKLFGLDEIGKHVGVVGLGGLGHVAVKFAKAFGANVTVISTSKSKEKEAVERLGADSFLLSHDMNKMQDARGSLDGIIDTVSPAHSLLPLIDLLKPQGVLVMLGAAPSDKPIDLPFLPLLLGGKVIAGSASGGMKETQEMLHFAAKYNVVADVEVISMEYVNTAMDRLAKADVRYRFVIDVGNTLNPKS